MAFKQTLFMLLIYNTLSIFCYTPQCVVCTYAMKDGMPVAVSDTQHRANTS